MAKTRGKILKRSKSNRMMAGVCGGLENYFGVDAVLFRVGFLIAAIPGGIPGILAYAICWIVIPLED